MPAMLNCQKQRLLSFLTALAIATAAGADSLEGWQGGSPACTSYPPWLPSPHLVNPFTHLASPKNLTLTVPRKVYQIFLRRSRQFVSRGGGSGVGGGSDSGSSSCCGLATGAPALVIAQFRVEPDTSSDPQLLQAIATLLPHGNSLLQEQDRQLVSELRNLVRAGLFGKVSLHHYLQSTNPSLLAWVGQGHLFCLSQSHSRLRLIMTRPLNADFEAGLQAPFRLRFRLAPCDDGSEDVRRAAEYAVTVRLLTE